MNKKILFLIPSLRYNDGIACAIMNYYMSLIESGWIVDFMLVEEGENAWNQQISGRGKIYRLPNVNKYNPVIKRTIETIIRKGDYSIVHVNIPGHVALMTLIAAQRNNVKIRIFHCHNPKNILTIKTSVSTYIYDHLCFPKATHFVACSNSTGVSRFGEREFKVIKNVIDPVKFRFNEASRKENREALRMNDNFVVGVVARISAQKNPKFILECFAKFKKLQENAKLIWIGDGEMKPELEVSIDSMGLQNECILLGKKSDVENWYAAMDLFFLPSKFEGLGIVFLEAQCTGLPCLGSTNVPVETEVTDLMYRLDLGKSAEQWAIEMKKISETKLKRHSRAQEFIDAGYTHEATKNDLVEYYNSLIK